MWFFLCTLFLYILICGVLDQFCMLYNFYNGYSLGMSILGCSVGKHYY